MLLSNFSLYRYIEGAGASTPGASAIRFRGGGGGGGGGGGIGSSSHMQPTNQGLFGHGGVVQAEFS